MISVRIPSLPRELGETVENFRRLPWSTAEVLMVVRELALRLTAAGGAHVEVACLAPWGPVADQLKRGGIHVTALNARGILGLPVVLCRLFRLIRAKRIDTVFSFLVHANMVAAALVYQSQYGGSGIKGAVLKNWMFSTITQYGSGRPYAGIMTSACVGSNE